MFIVKNLIIDGIKYKSVEHYFQSQKFKDNPTYSKKIINCLSPFDAKKLGSIRSIKIVKDWDNIRLSILENGLRSKFDKNLNLELYELLQLTKGSLLIENSPFDNYYGCGRDGKGKNMMGKLLMKIRDS
jgi:hypothetical protein